MTCWTRARVCSETFRLPLRAYETVLRDTPARLAISSMFNPAPHCLAAADDRGESIRVSLVSRLRQRQRGQVSPPTECHVGHGVKQWKLPMARSGSRRESFRLRPEALP